MFTLIASLLAAPALGQGVRAGAIRGSVRDGDFDAPLALAKVLVVETGTTVQTTDQGTFTIGQLPPGAYTLVFSKPGYVRQVRTVVVEEDGLADVRVELAGDITELAEFVVRDLQLGAGSEALLLNLRLEAPAFMDSIGSELMSRAGASDAASALKLVTGASVEDGKFAVIRGLPDRYVSSQMNGVRLPTADEDKRAVQLDQFPSAVIESLRVSKTFTPDQQGDASGGAVDVRLKGIPDETTLKLSFQYSYNSQVKDRDDFLSYEGGGVSSFGKSDGSRSVQAENTHWTGAVGTTRTDAPTDWKMSLSAGTKEELGGGARVGAFGSFFYERDSSYYDDGISDSRWVEVALDGAFGPLVPEKVQGSTTDGAYKTRLFDVTRGVQSVQWGTLATVGYEDRSNDIRLTYLYTRSAEDAATLSEDTRGKLNAFPGYDVNDPNGPGNGTFDLDEAPYIRLQTLKYTERTANTLQLAGSHTLPLDLKLSSFSFKDPVFDWTVAKSGAKLFEPDKRQFGSLWTPASNNPGIPPFIPPSMEPPGYLDFKPAANFTVGNLQRVFKQIDEKSDQYVANLRVPFEQWSGDDGYLKSGVFVDQLERDFDQDSYSNLGETGLALTPADFEDLWTDVWPTENHPLNDPESDVDYRGEQEILGLYTMVDLPLNEELSFVGGARFESSRLNTTVFPEDDAKYFPPGANAPVDLTPGAADVRSPAQKDLLPSLGLVYEPSEEITFRFSFSETVARQTFKEITPIVQQEFLGAPIFVGNPDLKMSGIQNYDVRFDYSPRRGSLFSLSGFKKDIDRPIEYVQRGSDFSFTTPVNFPKGELTGVEVEVRHELGSTWWELSGLAVGANATFIDSEVLLPPNTGLLSEQGQFEAAGYFVDRRPMTNAPDYLYNLYLTYDLERTQMSLFYSVQGDTLITGAGISSEGNYVPDVFQTEIGTLNFALTHEFADHIELKFQAKNLTNPDVETVYRGGFAGDQDVVRTSSSRGMEFALSLGFSL